jgi:hypothetical protein
MTGDASYVVVGWPEAIRNRFFLFKDEFVITEPPVAAGRRGHRIGDAFINGCSQGAKVIEQIVSFGIHISCEGFSCRLTFDDWGRKDR